MNQDIFKKIKLFQDKKVIVWGDIILDEYIYTSSNRVSREAPVLITEFESNRFILGGAGNVLMNIKNLGGIPIPVGFIGQDETGKRIKKILKLEKIRTDGLVELKNFASPRKSRIVSGGEHTKKQQVLRIDRIFRKELSQDEYQQIPMILSKILKEVDLILISDYLHQSVHSEPYLKIRHQYPNKIFLVDSRENFDRFIKASYIIPNEPEIKKLFLKNKIENEEEYINLGMRLIGNLDLKGVILKRGQEGMLVILKDKKPVKIGIHGGKNIVDVTGAGDTVISVIGLGLLAGFDITDAAKLANTAAGLVVMKEGVYPISQGELLNEFK